MHVEKSGAFMVNLNQKLQYVKIKRMVRTKKPIELRLKHHGSTNHFYALLRWKDIENLGYNYEEQIIKEVEQKEEKENSKPSLQQKSFPNP